MPLTTPPARVHRADLPRRVTVVEVGPRDGLQNEPGVVPTEVKIGFIDRLAAAGLPVVEATSFVRADRVPQMADAAAVMAGIERRPGTRYSVLVPNVRGLEGALAAGVDEVGVFASATDTFAQRNLGRPMAEQMAMFAPVVAAAAVAGVPARGYVSMCFGDPWEGAVSPDAVVGVLAELLDAGCATLCVADTIGVATAGQVQDVLGRIEQAGIALDQVGVHFHDTYGQALSNTLAALECGIATVDASAGGLGGCPYAESATGNLATEDLVWLLDGLGIETGIDLTALAQATGWLGQQLGREPSSRVVQAILAAL